MPEVTITLQSERYVLTVDTIEGTVDDAFKRAKELWDAYDKDAAEGWRPVSVTIEEE